MGRNSSIFTHKQCFIVLDGLIGGRITGNSQDTLTVFYRGGDSAYFHIGDDVEEVLRDLILTLEDYKRQEAYGAENDGYGNQ